MGTCEHLWSGSVSGTHQFEAIRPKETKIWPCKRKALHRNGSTIRTCKGIMDSILKQHISVSPQFCPDLLKSLPIKSAPGVQVGHNQLTILQATAQQGRPPGVWWVGLVYFPGWGAQLGSQEGGSNNPCPRTTKLNH